MTPDQKRMASALLDVLSLSRVDDPTTLTGNSSSEVQESVSRTHVSGDMVLAGIVLLHRSLTEVSQLRGQDFDVSLVDLREWLAKVDA